MNLQQTSYNISVSFSELEVATKFYTKVVGLSLKSESKDKVEFSSKNYSIVIRDN